MQSCCLCSVLCVGSSLCFATEPRCSRGSDFILGFSCVVDLIYIFCLSAVRSVFFMYVWHYHLLGSAHPPLLPLTSDCVDFLASLWIHRPSITFSTARSLSKKCKMYRPWLYNRTTLNMFEENWWICILVKVKWLGLQLTIIFIVD